MHIRPDEARREKPPIKPQDRERQSGMKKTILQFASSIKLIGWALIAQADELNLRLGLLI